MLKGKKFDAFTLFQSSERPFRDLERPFRVTEWRFFNKSQNKFITKRKQLYSTKVTIVAVEGQE